MRKVFVSEEYLDILGLKNSNMKKRAIVGFVLGKRMIMVFLGS